MNRRAFTEEKMKGKEALAANDRYMPHKLWYNKIQDFAYMQVVGELNKDHVTRLFSMMEDVFEGKDIHKLLIDVRHSPGLLPGRDIRNALRRKSDEIGLDRVAVLGADPTTRMTFRILLAVLGKTSVAAFCITEREAMAWLRKNE